MRIKWLVLFSMFYSGCVFLNPDAVRVEKYYQDTLTEFSDRQPKDKLPTGIKEIEGADLGEPGKRLDLDRLIETALRRNPMVKAKRAKWDALSAVPGQVSSLPFPSLKSGVFINEIETRNGPMKGSISLSQRIPFFGKLKTKGRMAEAKAAEAREEYRASVLDIMAKAKSLYYELYYITKAIKITREVKELLDKTEEVARVKYESNRGMGQQNVLKAQVEISRLLDRLITLREARENIAAKINTICDRRPGAPVGDPEDFILPELNINREELYKEAENLNPELAGARHAVERSLKYYELKKLDYYPDFMLGYMHTFIKENASSMAPDPGGDADSLMFGITLPVWWKKLRLGLSEAGEKMKGKREAHKNIRNMTLFEIKDLHFKIDTYKRLANLFATSIIPQAEQSYKASEIGYQSDTVDFLHYLDAERRLLHFRLSYWRAVTDYMKTFARLERVVGKELQGKEIE